VVKYIAIDPLGAIRPAVGIVDVVKILATPNRSMLGFKVLTSLPLKITASAKIKVGIIKSVIKYFFIILS